MTKPLLTARGITSGFGDYQVLWGVDLELYEGDVVAVLGPNGAGKSTMMAALSGVHQAWAGELTFNGVDILRMPAHRRVALGLSHVLERRRLFPYLSVRENLLLGATLPEAREHRRESEEWAYALFPILAERGRQLAHKLSGGEQQMLAIARGLMSRPKLLLLDEPLLGLSPAQVKLVADVIGRLRDDGVTILFIEQNAPLSLATASRCVLLRSGQTVLDAPTAELDEDIVMSVYVGEDPSARLRKGRETVSDVDKA